MRYVLAICRIIVSSSAFALQTNQPVPGKARRQQAKKLQPATNIFNQDPVDPCDGMTADECMASGTTSIICSNTMAA